MKSAIWRLAVGNAAGVASMVVVAPILARELGPGDRGYVTAATVPLVFASAALTFGVPETITYFVSRRRSTERNASRLALWMIAAVSCVGSAAIYLLSGPLSLGHRNVEELIRWSALPFFAGQFLWVLRGVAQARKEWTLLAAEKYFLAFGRVGGVVSLALADSVTVQSASLVLILAPLLGFIAYLPLVRSAVEIGLEAPRVEWVEFVRFGSSVWFGSIAGIILSRVDQVLLGPLSSARELGFYSTAVNVGEVVTFVVAAACTVLLSELSTEFSDSRLERVSGNLMRATVLATSCSAATINLWFGALFGHDFRPAIPAAVFLMVAAAVFAVGSVSGSALTSLGVPKARSYALLGAVVVNVGLLSLLAPRYGATGAAVSTLASALAYAAVLVVWLKVARPSISITRMLGGFACR